MVGMIKLTSRGLIFFLLSYVGFSFAEDNRFDVSPQKCITLKQGNNCYQDIEVDWQAKKPGNYCLTLSSQEIPVKCWSNTDKAVFEFEFIGSHSATLSLVESASNKLLGQANIEVKWVYRNRSRNLSWRVF
jgi:hypothetical protein